MAKMKSMNRVIDVPATLSLVLTILFWAGSPLFLKYFTPYIDAWTANGVRYSFAALMLSYWLYYFKKKGELRPEIFRLAIYPSVANIVGQVLYAWAPYFIDPGLMSFTIRLTVIWSILASFIMFADERTLIRSRRFWLGLVLSVSGFLIMITNGQAIPHGAKMTGIIIALFSSFCWAFYGVAVRQNMKGVDSRLAFTIISLYTAIGTLIFMFSFGNYQVVPDLPGKIILLILISSITGIGVSHIFFYIAVKRIGVAIPSTVNLLSSFLTAIFSFFIFKERLSPLQWSAGIILLLGAFLLLWAQEKVKNYQAQHEKKVSQVTR